MTARAHTKVEDIEWLVKDALRTSATVYNQCVLVIRKKSICEEVNPLWAVCLCNYAYQRILVMTKTILSLLAEILEKKEMEKQVFYKKSIY